ncbi:cobalt transporter CbiM [Meridianimarinicoccus sp. RP-17]|uniref:cobalt transporter CbiM n=1 Tax=Meridianimarinicoccus zhengii TaxID=2056810 RepID=UPI000DAC7299|nr:cobalt transporter CbiM [Phycocomes zhengii]
MHIPDGILSVPVLAGGAALAAAGVAMGLRRLDDRAIPRAAILSAAFFAGSLIAVPIGPTSVHLVFAGLIGVMLGWAIFPAVLVALALQAVLFGFGGLTALGVTTLAVAAPGALAGAVFGPGIRRAARPAAAMWRGALAGALAVLGAAALVAVALVLSDGHFAPVARVMTAVYLPLAAVEAAVTAFALGFLARVQPGALSPLAVRA